ncbi:bifunctional glutamate N-acetyltransferase/amino-acid acetyltransferase ArgJ [Salinisphaera sp.]|uniref:bifunctional glutamate N-acetyltransferase/amino-acid acetyltransferase ArgJ n=1 Tax=Salinisphaera sp. TaxID=1914330 RepID=UPI002D79F330|nr:bifunctional glutamate N-acetyltransferase/amino-acid acetyltransferase ArgJ [Salinisphaera sp.]HET7313168.1 bifunctional glutamate N-acetyltransferase/amino-acid acetyltransferase ArgJ [Salinisphaera sp.]
MAVNLRAPEALIPIAGARWASTDAAIKKPGGDDMALLVLDEGATVAGVFTRNAFAAAPVALAKHHMACAAPRALLINSGNANAGTGREGEADAAACCARVAEELGLAADQVLPFSTGVIGEKLPMSRLDNAIPRLTRALDSHGWLAAARAIMTTDTVPKGASRRVRLEAGELTLTGIAKGSGMIRPDMATMLSFLATDAAVPAADLDLALHAAVGASFNSITVDGDTSTNDAAMLCATGAGAALDRDHPDWPVFVAALRDLMIELACAIVRDAEGATRFITLAVSGAADADEARQVAFTVAHSPLFKTAAFAGDPNWGRILAAVGRAPVADLVIDGVDIALDEVAVVAGGQPREDYREADAARVMSQPEFRVRIGLGRGEATATVWTSDLSYDYVRINAEYRS